MAEIDISLLGKRYPELNETLGISSTAIIAVYRAGQPELDRITWLNVQKSAEIRNFADLNGVTLVDRNFLRWSATQTKFIPGTVEIQDIPNLPASIITSGVFPVTRIPDLGISKITGLQGAIDAKEDAFLKGDIVSSTLTLTGNVGRLFGAGDLGIEINTAVFSDLFLPSTQTIDFISSDESVLINESFSFTKIISANTAVDIKMNYIPYVHPIGFVFQPSLGPLTGATVISQIEVNEEGHTIGVQTRILTKADIGLGNVDNTSDLNKPISTATQTAINNLDTRFLRKDISDNNGVNTITLGNLVVNTAVTFGGMVTEISPDFALVVMIDGTVKKAEIVTPTDISGIQTQIDGIQTQVNNIVQDKNFVHVQSTLASTWTVNHNLGKECSISVYDSSFNAVSYAIDETISNLNTTVLVFLSQITGKAIFN